MSEAFIYSELLSNSKGLSNTYLKLLVSLNSTLLGGCLHSLYIEKKVVNNKVKKGYAKEIGKELSKKLSGQTFFF